MAHAPSPLDTKQLVSKEGLNHIVLDSGQMKAFAPPLVIGEVELHHMMNIFVESVREVLQEVGT